MLFDNSVTTFDVRWLDVSHAPEDQRTVRPVDLYRILYQDKAETMSLTETLDYRNGCRDSMACNAINALDRLWLTANGICARNVKNRGPSRVRRDAWQLSRQGLLDLALTRIGTNAGSRIVPNTWTRMIGVCAKF